MKIVTTVAEMSALSEGFRCESRSISLVPTMGYLHEGHLSLVRAARATSDKVVASIFVNPTQFGPAEDLDRYPRDHEGDSAKLANEGVDILFCPTSREMYPSGYRTYVSVEEITAPLCGSKRPGHFRGVATIVTKLFSIIRPHTAFFGQKDYQQTLVIRQLTTDLNLGVEVRVLPTIREADGLAMSSRNSYLSVDERKKAILIYKSLCSAEKIFASGEHRTSAIVTGMEQILRNVDGIEVEYLSVVDGTTLEEISVAKRGDVVAVAARVGRTRLIDNTIL